MKTKHLGIWVAVVVTILLLAYSELAARDQAKVVIGPRNGALAEGARALTRGNGELGVRLTLRGLEIALGAHEIKTAHANLCAGYVIVDKPWVAIRHCNWVLSRYPEHWRTYNNRALAYMQLGRFEESAADVRRGQELNPNSRKLKEVKGLLLDETQPVQERIEVDERRTPPPK